MQGDKRFNSAIQLGRTFAQGIPDTAVKEEPMFFNSSIQFAYANGGEITRSFLDSLPLYLREGQVSCVFDSRSHMLMPGWYPAFPGFHHDDVPRPPIPVGQHFATAGQPDYDHQHYHSQHIFGLVNATICPTEFAIGEVVMPEVPDGELIYRNWDRVVKAKLESGEMESVKAPDRQLVFFDCDTFHQATKAVSNGWRWFGRVTFMSDRTATITNELRKQTQVYLEFPMEGW